MALTAANQTATQNLTINNTANKDIAAGHVNVTAIDIQGESIITDYIPAANFSAGVQMAASKPECDTTAGTGAAPMANGTSKNVTVANITAGNTSTYFASLNATGGVEAVFFCLRGLNQSVNPQSYSTSHANFDQLWTVAVD